MSKREAIEAQYPRRKIVSRGPVQVRPDLYTEELITVPWVNLGSDPDPDDLIDAVALSINATTWAWIRHDNLQPVTDHDRALLETEARVARTIPPKDDDVWTCGLCEEQVEIGDVESPLYGCNDCGTTYTRDGSMDGASNRCPDCNRFGTKLSEYGCPECNEGDLHEEVS